ncbi:MAG: dihydrodipicolinate synthase family protein [Pseudomonadota bacterium]|jgi:4-hydroxy-tetrahydrodipicolinate synthase|nr:MAG: dihydrodipicolinate synthase family protein [Pseudomonadota bacterium]
MKGQRNFSGVIAPVLTPFGEDGAPDPDRFIEHAEWLLEDGCTALAPFGTTSEANSLGLDERMELLEELVDSGIDPAKLMPGTGSCSVTDATILTQHAVDLGCGGVLMLPPFYYKNPSEEGLFRFFAEVIDDVGDDRLRVYLYHIPPVAQVGFSLSLIDRLRKEFPGIVVGLKDSSGDWSNMKAILDAFPDFELFPGSELFLLEGLRNGAAGVISATANVSARAMRRLYDDWRGPNAEALQEEISALRRTIQSFPVIPTLKALIAHYRNDRGWAEVRPPFTPLPPAEAERAIKLLADQHNFRLEFAEAA